MASYSNNFEGLWALTLHKISHFSLENHRFALGVSGGADSIGLFHVFLSFFKQKKISDLVIFHINFGLRGEESDGDEAFVRAICEQENLTLIVRRAYLEPGAGIQEAARDFRRALEAELINDGYTITLAHNNDDVAENIILRLCRGTSLETAAGMTYFDGKIFRPWLDVSRERIRINLRDMGINWREDSSNKKNIYSRNKIRNDVMPILESIFPGATDRIARSFLDETWSKMPTSRLEASAIPMADLASIARSALGKVVHDFIATNYGGQSPVSRPVIDQIATVIHRVSTALDGQKREFQLPSKKCLLISPMELRIIDRN